MNHKIIKDEQKLRDFIDGLTPSVKMGFKTNFIIKKLNKNGKRENDFRRKMCLLQGNFC